VSLMLQVLNLVARLFVSCNFGDWVESFMYLAKFG
jgi:hypothetical protein